MGLPGVSGCYAPGVMVKRTGAGEPSRREGLAGRGLSGLLLGCALLAACGNPVPEALQRAADRERGDDGDQKAGAAAEAHGVPVKPPFAVRGELEGLLVVWVDAEGVHTAKSRADIPAERRAVVRVDSLALSPDKRLDPDQVYVADVRTPGDDGSYPVKRYPRAWFEAQVESLATPPLAVAAGGVTLYGASWCGACRSAAAYLRSRHVDFVEKDIEKDAQAAAEMQAKARAAGKTPRGVPVIDFEGTLLMGFDKQRLAALIDAKQKAI